jgi:hypothetical protein
VILASRLKSFDCNRLGQERQDGEEEVKWGREGDGEAVGGGGGSVL